MTQHQFVPKDNTPKYNVVPVSMDYLGHHCLSFLLQGDSQDVYPDYLLWVALLEESLAR